MRLVHWHIISRTFHWGQARPCHCLINSIELLVSVSDRNETLMNVSAVITIYCFTLIYRINCNRVLLHDLFWMTIIVGKFYKWSYILLIGSIRVFCSIHSLIIVIFLGYQILYTDVLISINCNIFSCANNMANFDSWWTSWSHSSTNSIFLKVLGNALILLAWYKI